MSMQQPTPGLPPINTGSVRIETNSLEEYYGIDVTFTWETVIAPEEMQRLQVGVQQETSAAHDKRNTRYQEGRLRGNRTMPPIERGDFPSQGLVLSLLRVIRKSAEWNAFYADTERRTLREHQLDGAGEHYGDFIIPVFDGENELLTIELSTEGGTIVFHTRDA